MAATKAIVCIDDEKTVLDSLKAQLKRHFRQQLTFEFAQSAEEGIEVIEELRQEGTDVLVVVSDWLMPQMKGDELLMQLHTKYPEIIKVLLTGQADQDAIERAKNNGGLFRCLSKPWEEEELLDVIQSGLARL